MSGTGRIFKRDQIYWIDFSYRGRRYRESSGSIRKSDAQALLRRRLGEASEGKIGGPQENRVTFEDLVEMIRRDYRLQGRKSLPRLERAIKHLQRSFALSKAREINTIRIERHIDLREAEGAATATIQKEMAALKRMFRLALQNETLSRMPYVPVPKPRNTRTNFLDGEDLERVIEALPPHLKGITRFASITGWRKQEILGLQWSNVDTVAKVIRLDPGSTKNDEGREVPYGVLPELEALLEDQRAYTDRIQRHLGRITPWVFHYRGKRLNDFRRTWNATCENAGVQGTTFYDLRRTAIRNLERAGVSRSVAMKITGHKTEAVYRRYAIADQRSLEEGLEKLATFRAAQSRHNEAKA